VTSTRAPLAERPPGFTYQKQSLYADRIALAQLAERFGTPLYVYSASTIRDRLQAFHNAF